MHFLCRQSHTPPLQHCHHNTATTTLLWLLGVGLLELGLGELLCLVLCWSRVPPLRLLGCSTLSTRLLLLLLLLLVYLLLLLRGCRCFTPACIYLATAAAL
jgi:hypothetical protein